MSGVSLFAVALPGLEAVVADELRGLGIIASAEPGGVAWEGSIEDVATVNLMARTPGRLLLRIGSFNARTFHELERRSRRIDWARFVGPERPALLRVSSRKSKLYHEGAVAERLYAAIAEAGGAASAPATSDEVDAAEAQLFVIRLLRDRCTISADTSGERLHRRGYRQALARAPLRETLAAAMLLAAGWDRRSPLLDPLCGSGTIAIEAALLARAIPPGLARAERSPRDFAFTHWADFDSVRWNRLIDRARHAIRPRASAPIIASDRAPGAIRAARANAERAGVLEDIEFSTRPLREVEAPGAVGWLVTNPPWGRRAGSGGDAARTLNELDRLEAERLVGWTCARLVPDRAGRGARFRVQSGGVGVRLEVREH